MYWYSYPLTERHPTGTELRISNVNVISLIYIYTHIHYGIINSHYISSWSVSILLNSHRHGRPRSGEQQVSSSTRTLNSTRLWERTPCTRTLSTCRRLGYKLGLCSWQMGTP